MSRNPKRLIKTRSGDKVTRYPNMATKMAANLLNLVLLIKYALVKTMCPTFDCRVMQAM